MKYSSPQAYLNRFFKKKNKFIYGDFDATDQYRNENWLLTWIDNENFIVSKRIIDWDTGADFYDDVFDGNLVDCVKFIKNEEKGISK